MRAYRPETAIAEKLHAMVTLGSKNSRMRDFFDVRVLAERETFDGRSVAHAIRMTFERRGVSVPETPLALTPAFADVEGKGDQWSGFLRKNGLAPIAFGEVIRDVGRFLSPVISNLAVGRDFDKNWPPGGPWR